MSRSLFSLVLSSFLFAASPAFAVFSEFVSVSPVNDTKLSFPLKFVYQG